MKRSILQYINGVFCILSMEFFEIKLEFPLCNLSFIDCANWSEVLDSLYYVHSSIQ